MMYPYQDEDKIREGTPTVPEAVPVWEQPAAHRPKRSRRALKTAALLCACLMVSARRDWAADSSPFPSGAARRPRPRKPKRPPPAPAVSAPAQSTAAR